MKDTPSCRILTVSPSLDVSVNLVQQIQRLSQPPSLSDDSTSLNVTNETEKHLPWTISNKYYTAKVHFLARQIKGLAPYHLQGIPALIFVWEKGETYKHHIHRLSKDLGGSEPKVSLAVRVSASKTPSEEDNEDEDEALEDANAVDEFLSSHGFEFVDASGGEQAEELEGISNGIPSLPRVLDALSTIMWPSMQTSQKSTRTATQSRQGNDAFLDWAQLSFDNSLDEDSLVTPTSGQQSDHQTRLHKEMNELSKWLQEEGEELTKDNDDPWKVTGAITSPTEIDDDDVWGSREKSTVKTGVVDAFDDDFSVFVSAPAETETRQQYTIETANKVSFDTSFDSSFDFDRLGPSPLGMTYHALGSGSDLGDPQESGLPQPDTPESDEEEDEEEEEDLPSQDEIKESAQRIFGAQGGTSSSDDFELAPFDIGQVMNALQGMKAEIADMEEESERRKAAARIALGLVYGLERDPKVEEDFDLHPEMGE